jgi:hypothetical protein
VLRGFDDMGDDNLERFGANATVTHPLVTDDELDVIEQCYGVKPVLMSKTSFKREKLASGKILA